MCREPGFIYDKICKGDRKMTDVKDYCENMFKRLVALKAGLYDVIVKAESVSDSIHSDATNTMKSLVANIEAGLNELNEQCPSDWSPNKKELDSNIESLSKALGDMAKKVGVTVPDSTAWI